MLRIDEPCTERWDGMTGDVRRRFCATCRKHVHDLSAMTEPEALAVLNNEPEPCVRFTVDGFGRILHRGALAAGALVAATPALASTAPADEGPGMLQRIGEAVAAWWSGEADPIEVVVPPPPLPQERVRHVLMGAPRPDPRPVVAGIAEIELAAGSGAVSLEVRCTEGSSRQRYPVPGEGPVRVELGAGSCSVATLRSPPVPVAVGDDLVCTAGQGTLSCTPR